MAGKNPFPKKSPPSGPAKGPMKPGGKKPC